MRKVIINGRETSKLNQVKEFINSKGGCEKYIMIITYVNVSKGFCPGVEINYKNTSLDKAEFLSRSYSNPDYAVIWTSTNLNHPRFRLGKLKFEKNS